MGVMQWVLIGFIVLLLIAYPLLMARKNKKENEKIQEQTNSLKRGDEILTTAGVYGKILEVKQDGEAKKVVIETGSGKNKSYLTIDAYSIYTVLNKPVAEPAKDAAKAEVKTEEVKTENKKEVAVAQEKKSEVKPENTKEAVKKEEVKAAKKSSNKKAETKTEKKQPEKKTENK